MMLKTLDPFRFLLLAVAGWMNQNQHTQSSICVRKTESFVLSWAADGFASQTSSGAVWQSKPGCWEEKCWPKWPLS